MVYTNFENLCLTKIKLRFVSIISHVFVFYTYKLIFTNINCFLKVDFQLKKKTDTSWDMNPGNLELHFKFIAIVRNLYALFYHLSYPVSCENSVVFLELITTLITICLLCICISTTSSITLQSSSELTHTYAMEILNKSGGVAVYLYQFILL